MAAEKGTIIISGASSGIGLACSRKFLQEGFEVVGLARDFAKSGLEHPEFRVFSADYSQPQQLSEKLPAILESIEGPIRAVVNNAGVGKMGHLEQLSLSDIQTSINTNFLSHAVLTKAVLPRLKTRNSLADIIFMGSEAALKGSQQGSAYCASKFALRGFAQSLREECASSSVRVSLINPGAVRTDFFSELHYEPGAESENAIEPEEVANLVFNILHMRAGTVVDEINLTPQKRVWQKK